MNKKNAPNDNPTLQITRYFTNGTHPFQNIQWERRDALIEGSGDKPIFEQRDVSFPADWSQNATNIVAQKYFAGQLGSETREWSVKQLIGRVVEKIGSEGMKNGYFKDAEEQEIFEHELAHILVHQMAAFNSPVWFNIGVDDVRQQSAACFILSVQDHLADITRWYSEEALIFQNGSGSGLNISNLRGSDEPLSRGGKSSGPVTFMRAADSSAGTITSGGRCLAPTQLVYTAQGPITVQALAEGKEDFQVWSWDPETDALVLKTARAWKQEEPKTLVEVSVEAYDEHVSAGGQGTFSTSLDHPYRLHTGEYIQALDLRPGMELSAGILEVEESPVAALARVTGVSHTPECEVYDIEVDCETPDDKSPQSGHNFLIWDGDTQSGVGVIVSNTRRAAKMVILDVDHPDVEDFIWCKAHEEKKARALAAAGFDMSLNTPEGEKNWASIQYQNANNSVRLTDAFLKAVEKDQDWDLIARASGEPVKTVKARDLLKQVADAAWECADPGVQYDTTINSWHTCPNHSRINGSNPCSEFMHVDNSSCNLASMNLMKFRQEDGAFDVDSFRHAVQIVFLAQEILISFSDYPTEEITKNTRNMRQIGIGYANLGAYLMANGLAYDSDDGRQVAGSITALLHCEAYAQSARIAERVGPYQEYSANQDAQLRVIKRHRTAANKLEAWEGDANLTRAAKRTAREMVELSEQHGVRNSQATVLAPAGTISFLMDCDTTGVEPDFSLVKFKKLVGGGSMIIVNQTVPQALSRLGYEPHENAEIVEYIREHNSVVGAPHIKEDDYAVFDTAVGERSISYMGHLKMMAAVQPSLSGAISKCVVGDTLLASEKGLIRIDSLYDGEKDDTFRPESLRVASRGGKMTTDAFYYGGERPVREIELRSGHKIKGTYVHKVLVANPEEGLVWKQLIDINEGDYVAQQIGSEIWSTKSSDLSGFIASPMYGSQKTVRIPKLMTKGLAQLLGIIAAEGSVVKSNWTISVANADKGVLELTQNLWGEVFGVQARIVYTKDKCPAVVAASKEVVEFIEWLGLGNISHQKRIPDAVLTSKRSHVLAFLQGLALDAYTHQSKVNPNGKWAICLNSPGLLDDLQVVLNNLGIRSSRIEKYNKEYDRSFGEVNVSGEHARRMLKLVPFLEEHKNIRAQTILYSDLQGVDVHDVIPCVYPMDLWNLLPEKVAAGKGSTKSLGRAFSREFQSLRDPRTQYATRQMLSRLAAKPGVVLTDDLQEVLDDKLFFSPVQNIQDGEAAEVYDISVPGNHAFVANGIVNHNTVNLPTDITKEDIFDLYLEAWKMGLKAVAIYRDGTKTAQPLGDTQSDEENVITSLLGDGLLRGQRRRVPDDGQAIKRRFEITSAMSGNVSGHIVVGLFEDGTPGELFVNVSQAGSTLRGFIDTWARLFSMALQYGAPLEDLVAKQVFTQFEPSGFTNDKEIARAKSIPDYVVRWMAARFLDPDYHAMLGINTPEAAEIAQGAAEIGEAEKVQPRIKVKPNTHAPTTPQKPGITLAGTGTCSKCGGLMVQTGKCMTCTDCGETGGCG